MDETLLQDTFTKYYYMVADSQVSALLNREIPGMGFSLSPNSNKVVYIPYAVIPSTQTDYKGLKKDLPKLQITEYPNRKWIRVE